MTAFGYSMSHAATSEERLSQLDMILFPQIASYRNGLLAVGEGHKIYWECAGNPNGEPVLFLHGGPGSGCNELHRRYFNPDHYNIILLDQRGCGRSLPHGALEGNDTLSLIADLESLRIALGIEDWVVFGGSWGSTLAMSYAQSHPQRCRALILRGIFLGSAYEIDWFLFGMGRFFPEARAMLHGPMPDVPDAALLETYYERLTSSESDIHLPAAFAWSGYEASCATLLPSPVPAYESDYSSGDADFALALSRLEAHYFTHRCFLAENEILDKIPAIADIPAVIIHGRYDLICPVEVAFKLHAVWPRSRLEIVPDAGHSATEPGICEALVAATERHRFGLL